MIAGPKKIIHEKKIGYRMKLTDSHLDKYADILAWGLAVSRSKSYKPYDVILLRYENEGLPLVERLFKKLVEKKFHVVTRAMMNPEMEKDFFMHTDIKQRKFIGDWETSFYENLNGNVFVTAPSSLTHLKDVDPKRINELATSRKKLRDILTAREERGLFGWTLCTMPTKELAKRAGLSAAKYTEQIVKACFLDENDPVAKWKQIHAESEEIKGWLNSLPVETLRLESNNCDLTIRLGEKRRYLGVSGHNIPSFEIFTSPDWRGANGRYFANLPSYRAGNYVTGVRLEFTNGSVTASSAAEGEEFLKKMLAMDPGAKRIGEFSLTDKRFSKIDRFMADTLFDENFGGPNGNCHIAVGMSYSDAYKGNPGKLSQKNKNDLGFNDSALHWDLVNTEKKRVSAKLKNGKTITIYDNGMFKR